MKSINITPTGKEYFQDGYRKWVGKEIWEFELTKEKIGRCRRYIKYIYKYSKLYKCKRCGKISGDHDISYRFYDLSTTRIDYDNMISGLYCRQCKEGFEELLKLKENYKECSKLLKIMKREISNYGI